MKRKILALVLCFTMVFTMTGYFGIGDYSFVYAEDVLEEYIDLNDVEEEVVETEKTIYQELFEAATLVDFRAIMMAEENREDVLALSSEEIQALIASIENTYGCIATPSEDEIYIYEELIETLNSLPSMECLECGEIGSHLDDCVRYVEVYANISGDVNGQTISSNTRWDLTGNVNLKGTIRVKKGATLKIYGAKTIKRASNFTGDMFYIEEGATLHINGESYTIGEWDENSIVLDGNSDVTATGQIIDCSGKLSLRDTVVRNNKGYNAIWLGESGAGEYVDGYHIDQGTIELTRTKIENCTADSAAAIRIDSSTPANYKVDIWNSMIYNCSAIDASAIYFYSTGQAEVVMRNSVVDNCDTTTGGEGRYGGALRTNGNGRYKFTMTDSILRNCDSWKFGGGIYWNASGSGAMLTVNDCQFLNNTAVEMGGGMFLEGSNMTITASLGTPTSEIKDGFPGDIVGTLIKDNYAPNGGGISYKCYSNDEQIQIPSTVASFDKNVIFTNNRGKDGPALAYNLHDTHNYPKNAKFEFNINGAEFTNNIGTGYGGAIYVRKCRTDYKLTVNFNSGTITNNTAKDGGAIAIVTDSGVTVGGTMNMYGGTLSNNTATNNGGALYLQKGDFNLNGGNVIANYALNGGAACIEGGNFTMGGGTLSDNVASQNGGAAYITTGSYTMNGGTIEKNTAETNGGAIYVNGGGVTMTDGTIQKNKATENGGALYVVGGNFTMTSGKLIENTAGNEKTLGNGGAAYVTNVGNTGGNVIIGVEKCAGSGTEENPTPNHTVTPTDKMHPIIEKNTATDSGGGIALIGKGNITMYCGDITENEAINRGRGLNIYMEKGQFDYYNGDVGKLLSPELVIVGGKLNNYRFDVNQVITLKYFHCNIIGDNGVDKFDKEHKEAYADKIAEATKGSSFNLPDGEKYWTAPDGYRFFGWTFYGPNATDAPEFVRNKTHYQEMGNPILANDNVEHNYDGTGDGTINMYALWAPEQSKITYAAVTVIGDKVNFILDDEKNTNDEIDKMNGVAGNPYNYSFEVDVNKNVINDFEKAGYTFKGWYIYQNEGQNANWGYEPVYVEGTTESNKKIETLDFSKDSKLTFVQSGESIDFGSTNFGDVTLIARFEPAYTDLRVAKEGCDSTKDINQTFVFQVTGTPDDTTLVKIDMTVTVHGNDSVLIKDLPVGKYQIKELTEWSWRYNLDNDYDIANPKNVTLSDPEKTGAKAEEVKFINKRDNFLWLSGDSFCDNLWNGVNDSIKRIFS